MGFNIAIDGPAGAGKSTIARSFRKLKGDAVTTVTTSVALDAANLPITLSEQERTSIFVFDEDFVTVNPYLGSDGVDPFIKVCKEENKG